MVVVDSGYQMCRNFAEFFEVSVQGQGESLEWRAIESVRLSVCRTVFFPFLCFVIQPLIADSKDNKILKILQCKWAFRTVSASLDDIC